MSATSSQSTSSENATGKKETTTAEKVVRAKRCIRAITVTSVVLSLISLGYGIYLTITCKSTFREYHCAITEGKSACSGSAEVLVATGISLFCMLGALGGHAHLRNALFVAATIQAFFGGLILILGSDTGFLTEGTADQMYSQMSECRHVTNSSDVNDDCWDLYRVNFCEDWAVAEEAICRNLVVSTTPESVTKPASGEAKRIIEHCVASFEEYAVEKYYFYSERAYPEMLVMAGLYLILATVLIIVGRKYEKEKAQLKHETELQTRATTHAQNSRSVHHPASYKSLETSENKYRADAEEGASCVEMENPLAADHETSDKAELVPQTKTGLKYYKYKK